MKPSMTLGDLLLRHRSDAHRPALIQLLDQPSADAGLLQLLAHDVRAPMALGAAPADVDPELVALDRPDRQPVGSCGSEFS